MLYLPRGREGLGRQNESVRVLFVGDWRPIGRLNQCICRPGSVPLTSKGQEKNLARQRTTDRGSRRVEWAAPVPGDNSYCSEVTTEGQETWQLAWQTFAHMKAQQQQKLAYLVLDWAARSQEVCCRGIQRNGSGVATRLVDACTGLTAGVFVAAAAALTVWLIKAIISGNNLQSWRHWYH